MDPATYNYEQAAERLNVTARWLQRRVQECSIPHRRFGHFVRFTDDDIDAIKAQFAVAPVPSARRRKTALPPTRKRPDQGKRSSRRRTASPRPSIKEGEAHTTPERP